jgi:hypothetical protein
MYSVGKFVIHVYNQQCRRSRKQGGYLKEWREKVIDETPVGLLTDGFVSCSSLNSVPSELIEKKNHLKLCKILLKLRLEIFVIEKIAEDRIFRRCEG